MLDDKDFGSIAGVHGEDDYGGLDYVTLQYGSIFLSNSESIISETQACDVSDNILHLNTSDSANPTKSLDVMNFSRSSSFSDILSIPYGKQDTDNSEGSGLVKEMGHSESTAMSTELWEPNIEEVLQVIDADLGEQDQELVPYVYSFDSSIKMMSESPVQGGENLPAMVAEGDVNDTGMIINVF